MLLFDRYEYNPQTDLIGKGGFSRVYKAFDKKFKRFLALKIYKSSEFSERYGPIAEIQRVIELDHPNITRYMDIDEVEKTDSFGQQETVQVCVMELLEGGNFAKYYNTHKDLAVFKKLLIDVLHGLSYLHKNGIIHRDIKPANILIKKTVDGPIAKITDFGISKRSDTSTDSSNSALIVSIPYMAPEQLNAQKYGIEEKIHYNIDLWSLGVAVYEIITGEVLFKNNEHDSSEQIMANIISPELPEKIKLLPAPFDHFVSRCIVKDANKRIKTAEELLPILLEKPEETRSKPVKQDDPPPPQNMSHAEEIKLNDDVKPEEATTISTPQEKEPVTDETVLFQKPTEHQPASTTDKQDEPPVDETRIFENITGNEAGWEFQSRGVYEADDETRIVSSPDELPTNPNSPDPEADLDFDETVILSPTEDGKKEKTPEIKEENIYQIGQIEVGAKNKADASILFSKSPEEKEFGKVSLFNRYDYFPSTDLIGKGGFSRVYKAFDKKLSRWVALKIYKTGEFSDRYSPIAEIKRVINLDHSNICRYLDIEELEKENTFGENEKIQVCVMELLDSGNFVDYYTKSGKDPEVLKKLVHDVLNGISYLHKNGIIHRDIKPANILIKKTIEGPVAKITDFGISKLSDSINNNSSSALIVSIPYMAPEQLNPRKYGINEKISFNLDLWSLGVTIYEVMTGKILFKNSDQDSSEQIMANIMAPDLPEKINELPQPFRNIVSHCVVKSANDRAQKAEELLVLLNSTAKEIEPKPVVNPQITDAYSTTPNKTISSNIEAGKPTVTEVNKEAASGTNEISDTRSLKKRFTVVDPVPEPVKKAQKHISNLKISIAVAAVLFVGILLFYLFASKDNKTTFNSSGNTDTVRKETVVNPPKVIAPVIETKVQDIAADTLINDKTSVAANEKKKGIEKKGKNNEASDTDPQRTNPVEKTNGKSERRASDKFLLSLISREDCTIRWTSAFSDELKAGVPMQLYLEPGSYIIEAVSKTTSQKFSRKIEVKQDDAGLKRSLNITF